MTKSEMRTLNNRILILIEEVNDPICQRYPTARRHVEEELEAARKERDQG